MKYYIEKNRKNKIVGKGYISEDVPLAENQIEVTEEEYNDIKFESVAVQVEELEQVEEKMNLEDIRTEFNNEIQQIRNSINGITKKLEENAQHKKCINESIINIEQRLKLMDSLVDKKEINEIVNKLTNEVNVIKEYQNNAKSESEENKSRLEKIENVISEMTKEPELTEREKINVKVVAKIRERYSVDDEFKMHRLGLQDQKNIEYLKYLNYVQQCIDWGNNEKKKLELGIEE